ncbi:export ABC transporter ATP-binding protein [Paenibacillus larvae subsp. pulvifaciens]|uniref:Export ABC transporter ATP-binding protein n=1 Tax=Paenibacillus larvae subsp. pulvifaciens TaxID=1477 RepID=A0A1V0URK4_9BACL|nr:ABC transporter ATP-binding protein [Paenibacillus larvae]ARF67804.1 export ABC transporter ATP-binding protein [Paenibacillus larvae subsp. pulvifaciens]
MLELVNLIKNYGDFTAVNNISLRIEQGEIFGLLGPNGAGKSTIVSMISTILFPTSGEIKVDNKVLGKSPREIKKIMGIVPQDLALYQQLTAKENLHFFGSLYGISGKQLKKRADEVLDIIELQDKRNQDVSTFSGGMKRRVNIGVALMNNPKLLILDEPTVGIDPQSRNHILETVKKLNEERGMTVIYTSHYMEEVEFLCKRVAIIDHGSLIALGTKEELKESLPLRDTIIVKFSENSPELLNNLEKIQGVEKVTVESNQIRMLVSTKIDVLDLVDDLKKLGVPIISFSFEEVNLESIFLQITGKTLRE